MKRSAFFILVAVAIGCVAGAASQGSPQSARPAPVREDCAKVWIANPAEVEEFLRTAPVERMDEVPVGVSRPKRIYFAPGGPAASAVWKTIKPGFHGGFQDSYTAEIAAYEMDKLLGLQMVPPYVERTIKGEKGAAGLWVSNVKVWKISDPVTGSDPEAWAHEIVSQKMFDLLIGNADRNQGNLLYDAEFHMVLIDHSRAFTTNTDISRMPKPSRFVRALWDRMAALTEADLQPAIGKWVSAKELKAVLQRRDKMGEEVKRLVKDKGERLTFMR